MKKILESKLNTLKGSVQYLSEMTNSNEEIPSDNLRTHGELIKNIGYDLINEAVTIEERTSLRYNVNKE